MKKGCSQAWSAAALLVLNACTGVGVKPPLVPRAQPVSAAPAPAYPYPTAGAVTPNATGHNPPRTDTEYRNGYDIGARDRSYGYPKDERRAYTRFGRGAETDFQKGYADGFEGRPMRQ